MAADLPSQGNVGIVRYAADFVVGFQYESDGRAFLRDLQARLYRFQLTLHSTKTRLIKFGRFATANRQRRGQGKPETFDFLGLTHICSVDRLGRYVLRRITAQKRFRTMVDRHITRPRPAHPFPDARFAARHSR